MTASRDPVPASCLKDMARGFDDRFRAFERRIEELELEIRRKQLAWVCGERHGKRRGIG